ncbi:MAG: flagellar motor switch protein FliN [Chitinispirillaceae bacterium]|nr:flagellar motor switch protein FliN [Chitinispirillaceae bacterium]
MSEILSQDQIDQLLTAGGFGTESFDAKGGDAGPTGGDRYASLEKSVALFCTQASSVLSATLNKNVTVSCDVCGKSDFDTIKTALKEEPLCVALPFGEGLSGEMYLLLHSRDVAVMADLMMMGEGNAEYAPEHNDALTEMSNQIMSSFSVAFASETGQQINTSPSSIAQYSLEDPPAPPEQLDMAILKLAVEGRDEITGALIIPEQLSLQLVEKNPAGEATAGEGAGESGEGFTDDRSLADQYGRDAGEPGVSGVRNKSIEVLLDVDLDVSIELGQTSLTIKRILELAPGSVVELDRMAGEPVDLLVNNKPIAKGEVVVVDESFGIRILSLVSPEERIKSLR